MADKDTLWTAVKDAYPDQLLVQITNVHDPAGKTANDTTGTAAAEHVIGLWPRYAQEDFDVLDAGHMAAGIKGVVAILMERGAVADEVAEKEWSKVFGSGGLTEHIRDTGPRARVVPSTNGPDVSNGRRVKPWSESMPPGLSPARGGSDNDY